MSYSLIEILGGVALNIVQEEWRYELAWVRTLNNKLLEDSYVKSNLLWCDKNYQLEEAQGLLKIVKYWNRHYFKQIGARYATD